MKINVKPYEEKMQKTIAAYESNLAVIRAGQANPMVLAKVTFEYYGAPTLINTMADIRVVDAKTIMVTPYDKTTLKAMEKAILASDVGITPNNDGSVIRLSFPQPTEERRNELNGLGASEDVINSPEFKEFQKMFNADTPISKVYETYKKTQPQKEYKTTGSMRNNVSTKDGIKDFYTPEEARRFTVEDFNKLFE